VRLSSEGWSGWQALDTWLGLSGDALILAVLSFPYLHFGTYTALPSFSLQNPDTNKFAVRFFFLTPCRDGFQNFHLHLDCER
jgi:hypothetical protein